MQDDIQAFKTEVLVKIARLEGKVETLGSNDLHLQDDIEELKQMVNENLKKLDDKCTYIERDMPSASTYKFIIIVVGVVITAAVGIITSALR